MIMLQGGNGEMPAAVDEDDDVARGQSPDLLSFLDDFELSATAVARFVHKHISLLTALTMPFYAICLD